MGDVKDQIFGKVSGDIDFFKQIAIKLPGFKGYIERTERRDSDKLLREYLFDRSREIEGRISQLQRDLINQKQIQYVDDLESAAIKVRTFADKIKTAPRGYAGLFDAVKINEPELAQLYEYDATMLSLVDQVNLAVDNLEASIGTDGLPAAIRNLETKAQDCLNVYDRRDQVILGIQ